MLTLNSFEVFYPIESNSKCDEIYLLDDEMTFRSPCQRNVIKSYWVGGVATTSAGVYAMFFPNCWNKSSPLSSYQCFHGSRREGMMEVSLYVSSAVFGTPRLSLVY